MEIFRERSKRELRYRRLLIEGEDDNSSAHYGRVTNNLE